MVSIPFIVIGVFVLVIIASGFVTVNQGNVAVITVFGKYRRIMAPGLNFKIPLIELVSGCIAGSGQCVFQGHVAVRGL